MRRWNEGYPTPIAPSDWKAWADMGGHQVTPREWAALRKIDGAYVAALSDEIKANADRMVNSAK